MFSEPVESLNATAAALRAAEPQTPRQLKDLLIRAADELDDQHKRLQEFDANLQSLMAVTSECGNLREKLAALEQANGVSGSLLNGLADRLQASTEVRIGQMDSQSRVYEKTAAAQSAVLDVARVLRDVAAMQ